MPYDDGHDATILQDIVNAICDDEDIRAVSFVGSNTVSKALTCIDFPRGLSCIRV